MRGLPPFEGMNIRLSVPSPLLSVRALSPSRVGGVAREMVCLFVQAREEGVRIRHALFIFAVRGEPPVLCGYFISHNPRRACTPVLL